MQSTFSRSHSATRLISMTKGMGQALRKAGKHSLDPKAYHRTQGEKCKLKIKFSCTSLRLQWCL